MKVRAEGCYSGGKFYFRVTVPAGLENAGQRFRVNGLEWGRKQASEALDELCRFGAVRRNIRFEVE